MSRSANVTQGGHAPGNEPVIEAPKASFRDEAMPMQDGDEAEGNRRPVVTDGARKPATARRYGEGLPSEVTAALRLLAVGSLAAAVVWGPAYYTCRQTKKQGQLYYGTTIGSCVRDQMGEEHEAVEAAVRGAFRHP